MQNIFFSDLDKTLLMSGFPNEKCVEYKTVLATYENNILVDEVKNKITFMTEKGFNLMQEVLKKVLFIPTTMRNLEQTKRIDWIREYNPKYIICSNGCEIYVNGEKDEDWEAFVRDEISSWQVKQDNDRGRFIEDFEVIECRNVNGYYFVWKLNHTITEQDKRVLKLFCPYDFRLQIDGKKAFFLPKQFNKAKAIEFLLEKYNLKGNIFVAGDSEADKEMLELPYVHSFIPKHSKLQLNKKDVYISENEFLKGSEDIIKEILKEANVNSRKEG